MKTEDLLLGLVLERPPRAGLARLLLLRPDGSLKSLTLPKNPEEISGEISRSQAQAAALRYQQGDRTLVVAADGAGIEGLQSFADARRWIMLLDDEIWDQPSALALLDGMAR